MAERVTVGQIVDAAPARVLVTRDQQGKVADARFDLSGLPRVEALLVGRPVAEVPALVERLCSICPVAHHLAGVRALESLYGFGPIPESADLIRRLLHYASVLSIHAQAMIWQDRQAALTLRGLAKAAMVTAGSPLHFPHTAVLGGVHALAEPEHRRAALALVDEATSTATRVAAEALHAAQAHGGGHGALTDAFTGANVALTDTSGTVDLFGTHLTAVSDDGLKVIDGATVDQWDELIAEAHPGSSAPRPYLVACGSDTGSYRVGPIAQLRAGQLPTPEAAAVQDAWRSRRTEGSAPAARAIMALHCVEVVAEILQDPRILIGTAVDPSQGLAGHARMTGPGDSAVLSGSEAHSVGVGWVDGARGLLVHRYDADTAGQVLSATILTPTAQNERWLGDMLQTVVDQATPAEVGSRVEQAIHDADPCLPCSSAPAGAMNVIVDDSVTTESE
ncbi:MAG: nickel-dependent hydrogenase large subunit [Cellulomonadaceae bacterium]|jgi:NAD-reducing hydrogenase large subunit|nr:nickel-dependent hydrogenase large subunit [Cellulomonadaceae bacterium]